MEMVIEPVVSAAIELLVDKITSSDWASFLRGKKNSDFDELLQNLKTIFLSLVAVLADAEQKQITNSAVKNWLDELQDAVDDAEDLFDEIEYDVLKHKVEASKSKVRKVLSTVFNSTDRKRKTIMEGILRRLKEFANQANVLGLKVGGGEKLWRSSPSTSLIAIEVYGREHDKDSIMKLLMSDDVSGQEICVIPIVGMGGIGKTTLAQQLFNDDTVERMFDVKIWVCVSDEYDVTTVTKSLLGEADAKDITDLNSLQEKLQKKLKGKKFLIVLDDVWNISYNDWNLLKKPFKDGAKWSKIIMTTRIEEVASTLKTVPNHHLKELRDEECWHIFAKHASSGTNGDINSNSDLKRIGNEIVKKCKGSPLAATTLGGLLRSTSNVEKWETIAKSEIWELKDNSILPALRLSYHYLPSHLKRCFVYCSIFPKDYLFVKTVLIQQWMAENLLVHSGGNKRIEEVGDEYFHDLVSRSFFQQSTTKPNGSFVMHDLMVDLAKSISGKHCCQLSKEKNSNEIVRKTHHLACHIEWHDPNDERFNHVFEATHLRTLLLLENSFFSEKVVHNLLLKMKCLRVLSLYHSGISELSSSIGELKHLRYLDLSSTSIKMLPKSVTMLYNLQTLKLKRCFALKKLPKDMHNLIHLRYLDVQECNKLEEMPRRVSKLKNLQMLSTFFVGKDSGAKIGELGELSELRGELFIKNLENVGNVENASDRANLKDKKHLAKLKLGWSNNCTIDESTHARDVLEMLVPNATLKELMISDYPGTVFPNWVGQCNIVFLELRGCSKCPSLPPLGQLASLKTLIISKFGAVVNVGSEFYGSARNPFPSLEILKFDDMPSWEQWNPIEVQDPEFFSNLRELGINSCYKLTLRLPHFLPSLTKLEVSWSNFYSRFPIMPQPWTCYKLTLSLPRFLPSLTKFEVSSLKFSSPLPIMPRVHELYINGCESLVLQEKSSLKYHSLERLSIGYCRDSFRSVSMDFFPNLKTLGIAGCDSFESLCVSDGQSLCHSLEQVDISFCRDSFRSVSMDFFPNLKTLKIWNCDSFESLCVSDGQSLCHSLEKVEIRRCGDSFRSVSMDFFPNLKTLRIEECDSFESLCVSDGQCLSSLSSLSISECPNFVSFPKGGLPAPNLTYLGVYNCKKLKRLPEKMHELLTSLQTLDISGCTDIETFPEGGLPLSLTMLEISSSYKLIALWSNLQTPPNLETLVFKGDEVAESFPEEGLLPATLVTITTLQIYNFKKLRALYTNRLQQFTSLKILEIFFCSELQTMPDEGFPASLEELDITFCTQLQTLPEQGFPVSLKKLTINSCYELQTLPEQGLPTSLEELDIHSCYELQTLPEQGLPTSLKELHISFCNDLLTLPEQGLPTSLRYLSIDECPQLEKLCRRDGQYWSKIHHINKIEINGEDIKSETSTSN